MVHVNIFLHQCKIFSNRTIFSLNILSTHSWKNGVIERKYHHILDTTRTLLMSTFIPRYLYEEAFLTALSSLYHSIFLVRMYFSIFSTFNSQFDCVCFALLPFMNVTSFPLVQSNAYFLGIVLLTKGVSVMILSIDVYVLLVMLNFLNRFLIMQLRQILIFRFFNLPLPLLLSLLNLHPYLHQLSLALYPYYYTCI